MRGATNLPKTCNAWFLISIHAPREGCDCQTVSRLRLVHGISIHAPREGCDHDAIGHLGQIDVISIHAPREGCDSAHRRENATDAISIHAPREGCDRRTRAKYPNRYRFQSTHPVRGATHALFWADYDGMISIHAPREGCDARKPETSHQAA